MFMARYAYIGIPSAVGGERANYVHVVGGLAGLRFRLQRAHRRADARTFVRTATSAQSEVRR